MFSLIEAQQFQQQMLSQQQQQQQMAAQQQQQQLAAQQQQLAAQQQQQQQQLAAQHQQQLAAQQQQLAAQHQQLAAQQQVASQQQQVASQHQQQAGGQTASNIAPASAAGGGGMVGQLIQLDPEHAAYTQAQQQVLLHQQQQAAYLAQQQAAYHQHNQQRRATVPGQVQGQQVTATTQSGGSYGHTQQTAAQSASHHGNKPCNAQPAQHILQHRASYPSQPVTRQANSLTPEEQEQLFPSSGFDPFRVELPASSVQTAQDASYTQYVMQQQQQVDGRVPYERRHTVPCTAIHENGTVVTSVAPAQVAGGHIVAGAQQEDTFKVPGPPHMVKSKTHAKVAVCLIFKMCFFRYRT